ncbi:HesA/MoeB/ThiF family protein [Vibrio agarivorans]|uniref:HesA/MoeB/ThiF family protein n=1 Tax=Vibrio agarivorans TaxID=153622 RepID=UPI0025B32E3B|nr:HesA/MoeB/ThiF family protein [Vibrio agarivorans]MDN3662015.1 HesA/MoeB/ThiF family protein [Vibrio agarivorans]
MLSDKEFIRYQRQIALPNIGEAGQNKLRSSHVLIVGCGGLGSAAALYLAAAGVGRVVLVDDDAVDSSNLQRQVVYREEQVGHGKADAMAHQLRLLNASCQIRTINKRLDEAQLSLEVMLADTVLDCTDNIESRQLINRVCFNQSTALIFASAIGWQGQFCMFDFKHHKDQGCYRCIYPFDELPQAGKCSDSGVVGPVVGTMGNYQALAAIQYLALQSLVLKTNTLHLFDGLSLTWQALSTSVDSTCHVCSDRGSQSENPNQ